jgi:SAM-dependent methyltransferase
MTVEWNHNTHHHRLLLTLLPARSGAALDVGCGDGSFAAVLASRFARVVSLDRDAEQVAVTSARCRHLRQVSVVQEDFLTSGFTDCEFDVVTALASFHHMPLGDATREARRVLRPGGRLVVLGVWSDSGLCDLPLNVASLVLNRYLRWRRGQDSMTAPATLERTSWPAVKLAASEHLPGARLRRRLLFRYTLVWDKPSGS